MHCPRIRAKEIKRMTPNNRIKIARKKRGLGPRYRSAVYASRYAAMRPC